MHKKGLTQPENRSNSNFRTSTCLALPKKPLSMMQRFAHNKVALPENFCNSLTAPTKWALRATF